MLFNPIHVKYPLKRFCKIADNQSTLDNFVSRLFSVKSEINQNLKYTYKNNECHFVTYCYNLV